MPQSAALPTRGSSRSRRKRSGRSATRAQSLPGRRGLHAACSPRVRRMTTATTPGADAYDLPQEFKDFQSTIRDLVAGVVAPRAAEIDRTGEYPWDVRRAFAEHDLLGLPFPEELGGTGTGTLMLNIAVEEVAKACASSALILMVQELGTLPDPAARHRRAEAAVAARLRVGREVARLLPVRARGGLGPRLHAHHRGPRRRRLGPQRHQELDHQRDHRRLLRGVRRDRPREAAALGLRGGQGRARASRCPSSSTRSASRARPPGSPCSRTSACRPTR